MKFLIINCFLLSFFCSSCATLRSKSIYSVSLVTVPLGAEVEVFDKKGRQILFTQSPDTISLRASAGYFKRAEYTIKASKDGYLTKIEPLYFVLDKKYIDNVFWLQFMPIGLLLIDPVSGAMWQPERQSVEIILNPIVTD